MIYIRTLKNKYNVDVIIDSTDNQKFVETTNLDWIKLPDEVTVSPENGSYYYDGKIIPLNSEDYDIIIVPIINQYEEPKRIEKENQIKLLDEERERELNEIILQKQLEYEEELKLNPPPSPLDEIAIEDLKETGIIDPRDLPRPTLGTLPDIESTEENFKEWQDRYKNISALVEALNSKTYKEVVERVVIFEPPFVFPDGVEQSNFAFPEDTIEEYLDYLIQVKESYAELLDKMSLDLNLPK